MKRLAVVALGGNALLRGHETGFIQQQERNAYNTCKNLISLLRKDYSLVITHGNGPQVGNILLRNEAGYREYKIPKMPLDICVADSQGGIGYMIERQLKNLLTENKIRRNVVTVVTQVLVDINDPAFSDPTKPVGAFFIKEEAELFMRANPGWKFMEDPRKRGWRRVVASPSPVDILNKKTIKDLARKGNVVIASGGGGIPVFRDEKKMLQGIEAVIDKDLASALLAKEIEADEFFILTDIPRVYINFNKPDQKPIGTITASEAKELLVRGEFAEGSMAPKIRAAIDFVSGGGKETIITDSEMLSGTNGVTRITANKEN